MKTMRCGAGLVLAALLGTAGATAGGAPPPVPLLDEPAASFRTITLQGDEIELADLEGQVVLLNFWGLWCRPCRQEIPKIEALYRCLRPHGLEILGVDVGDRREAVVAFVEEHSIPYPIVMDEELADRYDVIAYPTSVIIDQAGRIRHVEEGYDPETTAVLRQVIEQLLDRTPEPPEKRSKP